MAVWYRAGAAGVPVLRQVLGDPAAAPRILFIHENRGLSPYMLEVIDELAAMGFDVHAPDLLHRLGGTSAFVHAPESVSTRAVSEEVHEADLVEVFDAVPDTPIVLGFCFGAEMGWRLITRRTPQRAALLYGIGPVGVDSIRCPVLAVYAQDDPRVNDTLWETCEALARSSVDYRLSSYPGTRHAFHDHHRPERHHAAAAHAMWQDVRSFLTG